METTNDVLNGSLFQYVTQQSLLSWMRVMLANRMASDGKTWTSIFARYNSGTYPHILFLIHPLVHSPFPLSHSSTFLYFYLNQLQTKLQATM
jgi:hypothetical protein